MSVMRDVIIVGSGPSGANAAKQAIDEGLTVTLLDFGNDEPDIADGIPGRPFSDLRRTDTSQREYFLGNTFGSEVDRNDRLGSHFTAPRAFITKDAARLLPIDSQTFFPTQSLALGGLGVGWGAGCQIYESFELERAGMPPRDMGRYYDEVVRDIGISGAPDDDTAAQVLAQTYLQPPTDIDTNGRSILNTYRSRRAKLRALGLNLGRDPLAMLTEPLERPGIRREPNPYTDMDFYGNAGYSVYRPKYTIVELRQNPNFEYLSGALVERFTEDVGGVTVAYTNRAGSAGTVSGRKLLLAAGAINSARIALRSRGMYGVRVPLLCNQMHYLPCVNLRMLGRPADDRRHSLGQLLGVFTPPHRAPEHVILGVISYRSLLHFRIVRQMPLPTALGLQLSRALMTSLTMVGVHHPEAASTEKWLSLERETSGEVLKAHYRADLREERSIALDLAGVKKCLRALDCWPLATFSTNPGASIHYAGTMPGAHGAPLQTDSRGKLGGGNHVFVADSAGWNYLPAKGLTFTLMANARRVAHEAAAELRSS